MQNRIVAASQNRDLLKGEGSTAGTRHLVLVLIGLAIIVFQLTTFFLARSDSVVTPKATAPNLTTNYRVYENDTDFFVRDGLNTSKKVVLVDSTLSLADVSPLFFQPIPINSASPELLATIPGIGPRLAHQIRTYVVKNGGMKEISDLQKIKGIGTTKSKIIAEHVRI